MKNQDVKESFEAVLFLKNQNQKNEFIKQITLEMIQLFCVKYFDEKELCDKLNNY